ncbi:energy transducer TonB [Pelomonas sp. SE-A7]|uniref:energy transducer TonB n=1 Tax=Pelomonas sp. SE-A7 TaxID=3054953 RepID=UPI00259C7B22|nr:energy transducer TonB [Pelomonas sp. SE-A7]MDM4765751.1 energy transducer TonB [Pelomonas sp. SE-A7]
MNFAQEQKSTSRVTGFGIVVVIHVLIIWALASGLARKIVKAVSEPIETKVIEEKVKPPEEIKKVEPPPPKLDTPPPPFVPPPEVVITAPAPPAVINTPTTSVPPPAAPIAATPAPAPKAAPAPAPRTGPVTAAMVCTKMGKPEAPSVNWSGEALLKAVATVKAGRVVSVEIQSLRGGVERKALRAMSAAVTQTLQDTYECPGDHVFEQEFQFRIE